MSRSPLFDEFPPVSTEEWEEKIREDLGDRDYAETLLWHLPEGFTARPYYRSEDLDALEPPGGAPVDLPSTWRIRQDIRTPSLEDAVEHARQAAENDVDVVGLDLRVEAGRVRGTPLLSADDLQAIVTGAELSGRGLHLRGGLYSPALYAAALDVLHAGSEVSVAFDPIGESARHGRRLDRALGMADAMVHDAGGRGVRFLMIDGNVFHDAGAPPMLETALVLASAGELLAQLIERGHDARAVVDRMIVSVPVGSSFFLEMAKLRALRLGLRQLFDVFQLEPGATMPPIHGESSWRNATRIDPHTNLLRTTTEAASAVLGGCDVVAVHPFDAAAAAPNAFSYRMARNIQHILRHESGFGRVKDPAAGSYYVEVLTDAIARRAWQMVRDIEAEGGLFAALENGTIHKHILNARESELKALAEQRRILVGTNHHPAPAEPHAEEIPEWISIPQEADTAEDFSSVRRHMSGGGSIGVVQVLYEGRQLNDPLPQGRLAQEIEERRFGVDHNECERDEA